MNTGITQVVDEGGDSGGRVANQREEELPHFCERIRKVRDRAAGAIRKADQLEDNLRPYSVTPSEGQAEALEEAPAATELDHEIDLLDDVVRELVNRLSRMIDRFNG